MKKEHVNVKQKMTNRISAEMKRNKQTNEMIAERLDITPEHFSRLRNGKHKLTRDKAEILASMWGVMPDYVLGFSDCRTYEDYHLIDSAGEIALYKAVTDLLKIMGYEIDIVELLVITPGEIAAMYNPDEEIKAIEPYIIEPGELWPFVKKSAYNARRNEVAQYSESVFCFEISDGYIEKEEANIDQCDSLTDPIEDIIYNTEIGDYINFYARITKDGELIGYAEHYRQFFKIISKNAASLFGTLLSAYSMEIVKNKDININPDSDLPFA